jgi:L-seryl-tRNA(Ser) seleniumtransferase
LRVDKLTLAAMEATLRGPVTPTHEALHAPTSRLRSRAESLAGRLRQHGVDARAMDTVAAVGGGGAPGVELTSAAVSLPAGYAHPLRQRDPAVVGRVDDGRLLLDLRAVPAGSDEELFAAALDVAGAI